MSGKGFTNELERALARPDIEELRGIVAGYFAWHQATKSRSEKADDLVVDHLIDDTSDPDRGLALVVLSMAYYDEPAFLGLVAAGPLEDLLRSPSSPVTKRIFDEARKEARMRWMLSGVWLHAVHPDNVPAIEQAVGDLSMDNDTSLPPRPWA